MLAVYVNLEPNIYPKVTHPLQQTLSVYYSASAVRASKNVQLSQIENRLRAFQRAIDKSVRYPNEKFDF